MESQTLNLPDDFLSTAFENLAIAAPKATSPPPQQTPSTAEESIFSFLDSPSFQDDAVSYNSAVDWAAAPPYEHSDYDYGGAPAYGFLQMALNPETSEVLKNCLRQGMYVRETFEEVFPNLFELISVESGRHVFDALLHFCALSDKKLILEKFLLEKDNFALAALCESGSRAIQSFIKKVKNTRLAGDLTALISESAYLFMTHKFASHVVKQCFEVLGDEANKKLYNVVLLLFHHLAMDPVGCITINSAIDCVRGVERFYLLVMVVKNTLQLAYDPSGNYIVQHCLKLRSEEVTRGICLALKGEFVELAQKKGGSFVVEECLKSSEFGRCMVVSEIAKDEKLLMLAKDSFGNYPVQMALELTRIHDEPTYQRLKKVLEPRFGVLIQNAISGKRRSKKDLSRMLKNM